MRMEQEEDLMRLKRREEQKMQRMKKVQRQRLILGIAAVVVLCAAIGLSIRLFRKGPESSESIATASSLSDKTLSPGEGKNEPMETLSPEMPEDPADDSSKITDVRDDPSTLRFVAVGDNLMHERICNSGKNDSGNWNYDHLYTKIREDISSADLAMVNQECIFVSDHENVSGYPAFGAPTEVGDALCNAGFDILGYSNNHVCDKGLGAIRETIDYWKAEHPDITVLGIHDSEEDSSRIKTMECKGLTFSFLNYTSAINQEPYDTLPSYMVDLLREPNVMEDIPKARECSDVVVALLHTGTEYSDTPSDDQRNFLQMLLKQGVDITICAGPHVLQGFDTLSDEDGNEMLVYYSLGNFISTQQEPNCLLGGMADITLQIDPDTKEWSIANAELVPLVTHYNEAENDFYVCRLEDYSNELAAHHDIQAEAGGNFTVEYLQDLYQRALEIGK